MDVLFSLVTIGRFVGVVDRAACPAVVIEVLVFRGPAGGDVLVGQDEPLLADDEAAAGMILAHRFVEAVLVVFEREPAHQSAVIHFDIARQPLTIDFGHLLINWPISVTVIELPLVMNVDGRVAKPADVGRRQTHLFGQFRLEVPFGGIGSRRLSGNLLLQRRCDALVVPIESAAAEQRQHEHRGERRNPDLPGAAALLEQHALDRCFTDGQFWHRRRFSRGRGLARVGSGGVFDCSGKRHRWPHHSRCGEIERPGLRRSRRHVRRPRLHIKYEFRTAGAEFNKVVGEKLDLSADALAVQERAVAAIEIGDAEIQFVVVLDADHRVPAADFVVALKVELDIRTWIAAEGNFLQSAEIELVDLIDLRSAEVTNDNSRRRVRHEIPLARSGNSWAHNCCDSKCGA